jgi:hypothetical protein
VKDRTQHPGWTIRVGSGQGDGATAFVRRERVEIVAPLTFDAEASGITALEYLLLAVAGDLVTGFRALARRRRLVIDQVEALVHGELDNPLTHLGVIGEEGHPGLSSLSVKLYVGSPNSEEEIRKLLEEVRLRSPMFHTFQRLIPLELELFHI